RWKRETWLGLLHLYRFSFVKKLEAVNAEIGGSVTLTCDVSHAKGRVVWRRNKTEIKPSKRFQIHEEGVKRTLTITGIRAEDEGEYSCESRDDKNMLSSGVLTRG
uniref:Ig-like domain-containing protein n=1 Tax=Amazona collaria TaxID=241587 RepID=A0A8B9EYX3_9PSIT